MKLYYVEVWPVNKAFIDARGFGRRVIARDKAAAREIVEESYRAQYRGRALAKADLYSAVSRVTELSG